MNGVLQESWVRVTVAVDTESPALNNMHARAFVQDGTGWLSETLAFNAKSSGYRRARCGHPFASA